VTETAASGALKREVGVFGATMMGIGSMVGTGVIVSIGIAAGIAGPAVILAIALAAIVATCNALSSAQLAASMPVSGGTYEYGHAYLAPSLGFTAGWMFLCARRLRRPRRRSASPAICCRRSGFPASWCRWRWRPSQP
jgi:APA family basic amino acid/polyamine antiporter